MKRRKFITSTAATLPALALGQTLAAPSSRNDQGFVVKAKESRFNETTALFGGSSPNDIKVSSKDTDGELTIFEYTGHVKGGPGLHIHLKQDEIFFIVEGEYTFKTGDDIHHLKKGDTIFQPRGVPHTFAQTSDTGKMYFIELPSGTMEDFFRKLSTIKGQPTLEEMAKLSAEHDMKIVGPPLEI